MHCKIYLFMYLLGALEESFEQHVKMQRLNAHVAKHRSTILMGKSMIYINPRQDLVYIKELLANTGFVKYIRSCLSGQSGRGRHGSRQLELLAGASRLQLRRNYLG